MDLFISSHHFHFCTCRIVPAFKRWARIEWARIANYAPFPVSVVPAYATNSARRIPHVMHVPSAMTPARVLKLHGGAHASPLARLIQASTFAGDPEHWLGALL